MDDIVGIKVIDRKQGVVAFLTWGRVFNAVDPAPLLEAISGSLNKFGLSDVANVKVCDNLHEVSPHYYFFENLIKLSWKPIPYGKNPIPLGQQK